MGPEAWKRQLGEDAWNHIVGEVAEEKWEGGGALYANDGWEERQAADILTRACEGGFRPPGLRPTIDPNGTKVLWPAPGGGMRPVLTALGVLRLYQGRGHGFVILRVEQLLKAVAGPLLPRLQEIFSAYEEQCETDTINALPVNWRVFVGGQDEQQDGWELVNALNDQSPRPDPSKKQVFHMSNTGRSGK
jgi:hypothetical protein